VEGQHPVDREVPTDLAQERDVFEAAEPFVIVDYDRVGRTIAEAQETFETAADRSNVRIDCLLRQQLAAFILARRIADLRRPTAPQDYWLVARLLEPPQEHDRNEIADVQRRCCRVEPDVTGDDPFSRKRIECRGIGNLVDVAALVEQLEKGRAV